MAIECTGILQYDPHDTLKATTAEAVEMGQCLYIHTDGLAYLVDNGLSTKVHGIALKDTASGEKVTLITKCRMEVDTTQTIGARVYTGALSGGSAPSSTLATNGVTCGFAYAAKRVYYMTPDQPAA